MRISWQLRIDPDLLAKLREAAYQRREPIAELVDRALRRELETKPTAKPRRKS